MGGRQRHVGVDDTVQEQLQDGRPWWAGADRPPWWADRVGYHVYVRAFADHDGDGVGDLEGLRARLDYLAWLGVGFLWLSPCFPSPLHDGGYDVADYDTVADELGGSAALDRLLADAHARDIRVLLDLVPNHTSAAHPWFTASRSSRADPYRDWYVWRDGAADGGPPNNWVSVFGGPAWSYDPHTAQWWLHSFLPEQPDLNWANPAVQAAFDGIVQRWMARGVDGFRVDVAHGLVKHPALPDLPVRPGGGEVDPTDPHAVYHALEHRFDVDQPGVLEVYRRWQSLDADGQLLLLGEVYLLDPARLRRYVADRSGLSLAFWFPVMELTWDAAELRATLEAGAATAPGSIAWVTSSHDAPRAATRFGGGQRGRRRALVLATLQHALPGVPLLYQGEELALTDVPIDPAAARDPIAVRAGASHRARDGSRTPMPWQPGPQAGFSDAATTWLPVGPRTPADTVAVQQADPTSWLHAYRRLLAVRRHSSDLRTGDLRWVEEVPDDVIAFRRGSLLIVANTGARPRRWDQPAGDLLYTTDLDVGAHGTTWSGLLPAETAVIVRT